MDGRMEKELLRRFSPKSHRRFALIDPLINSHGSAPGFDLPTQSAVEKNWCPHTVTKTVTCQVQNGTILQRVYQTCRWPQGCTGGSYRTVVRPSYKVVYRTVTSLEWKCCPGFSGAACEEELEPDRGAGLLLEEPIVLTKEKLPHLIGWKRKE
ncbi:Collagen alpha-1(XXVI) chain [Collichthys lucidus]|uniref:Collagen alpha-1(XXVI) chain n=1 Tax=Collichthys lucidus TaxID=240159 RepID=A0A4U5UU09_COLLU|nr:Collagen alpha-1(XXVI) chain [Collichthys lucidus]